MSDRDLIVVGGGPAGVMTGLLFARAGCRVDVLEKHADFFRDFRGDTVHPSTMEILDQSAGSMTSSPGRTIESTAPSYGSPVATGPSATSRTSPRPRPSSR